MQRSKRKITAKETLAIQNQGHYTLADGTHVDISMVQQDAVANSKYYETEALDKLVENTSANAKFETSFIVQHATTIQAIQELDRQGYSNVMALNFASAKNPGGGFLNGAQAQEESVARSSGLHNCQMAQFDYYERHRNMKSCMYTDGMIYSPKVPVFRKDDGTLIPYINTSIITSAAVNAGVVRRKEPGIAEHINAVMKRRMDKMLALSVANGHEVLVLGAWGCGVFQNDPNEIAALFKEHFDNKYKGVFRKVVFAVYAKNEKFINAFKNQFDHEFIE